MEQEIGNMQENRQGQAGNRKLYMTGGVSFVAGFLLAWIFFGGSSAGSVAENRDQNNTASVNDSMVAQNAISVKNQAPGFAVVVASFTIEHEGWIAIHEDRGGAPGNILGARKVAAGTVENLNIPLLRATKEGSTNYAMLHGEDGLSGFNYKTDAPLTDASGKPIMASFKAAAAPKVATQ